LKLIKTAKLTHHRHLNLFRTDYKDRNGTAKSWIYASRQEAAKIQTKTWDRPDAVVIVPWHREHARLVVIKEFRVVLGGYQIGFPAGLMDEGETVVQTAHRELFEETGLSLRQVLRCSPAVYSSSGMTDETVALVYAECDGTPSKTANESSEDIEVLLVDRATVGEMLEDPGLKIDVKAWMVLSEFVRRGSV
jgi:ADP-ribose pyrophosphatase